MKGMVNNMKIDTNILVAMTDANQNFSKVVRMVDENGMAVILKNNKPRYMVVDFAEYEEIKAARAKLISEASDEMINDNLEVFEELAK